MFLVSSDFILFGGRGGAIGIDEEKVDVEEEDVFACRLVVDWSDGWRGEGVEVVEEVISSGYMEKGMSYECEVCGSFL